jgi:hypothetical protein
MIITPPSAQAMIEAGPAISAALSAPKSHPDPIMEPIAVNKSPRIPISRRSRLSLVAFSEVVLFVVIYLLSAFHNRYYDGMSSNKLNISSIEIFQSREVKSNKNLFPANFQGKILAK